MLTTASLTGVGAARCGKPTSGLRGLTAGGWCKLRGTCNPPRAGRHTHAPCTSRRTRQRRTHRKAAGWKQTAGLKSLELCQGEGHLMASVPVRAESRCHRRQSRPARTSHSEHQRKRQARGTDPCAARCQCWRHGCALLIPFPAFKDQGLGELAGQHCRPQQQTLLQTAPRRSQHRRPHGERTGPLQHGPCGRAAWEPSRRAVPRSTGAPGSSLGVQRPCCYVVRLARLSTAGHRSLGLASRHSGTGEGGRFNLQNMNPSEPGLVQTGNEREPGMAVPPLLQHGVARTPPNCFLHTFVQEKYI